MIATIIILGGCIAGVCGGIGVFFAWLWWDSVWGVRLARFRRQQQAVAHGKGWARG